MPSSSKWGQIGVQLTQLGMTNAASEAMGYAHDKFAREQQGSQMDGMQAQLQNLQANMRAGQQAAMQMGGGALPQGFVPFGEVKSLVARGRFADLPDGTQPALPLKDAGAMVKRMAEAKKANKDKTDQDAEAWTKVYFAAVMGDPAAMLQFGKICETGAFGSTVDPLRAFFFYYRAGILGHTEAQASAERLGKVMQIPASLMEEPSPVFPGLWRISSDAFGQATSVNLFNFKDNGTLEGRAEKFGGPAGDMFTNAIGMVGDPALQAYVSSMMQGINYGGRWQYDKARKTLTLQMIVSVTGVPQTQNDTWQVQLLGMKPPPESGVAPMVLFGRDRKMVTHVLEFVVQQQGR